MIQISSMLVTVLLALSGATVEGKKVVFLPFMAKSHIRVASFVAEELAKLGHQVWVADPTAHNGKNDDNNQSVQTFNYTIEATSETMASELESIIRESETTVVDWGWVLTYDEIISKIWFRAMLEGNLTEYVASLKPDLIVLDSSGLPGKNELVAIPYKLDVPFAVLSPLHDPYSGRIPINPVADLYNSRYFRTQASLYEQLLMLFYTMYPIFRDTFTDRGYINQIAPVKPHITTIDLMSQAEIFIFESDPIFDYPRPMLPNVKFVGGISSEPAKSLKDPFKSFVEQSEKAGKGIAVVSFGSLILRLSERKEAKLMDIFMQLKLNVIWRTEIPSLDPDKILTAPWIPQNDLLGNKNVKVFISHCGIHGQYEALYHGVPLVCMPFFLDQFSNSERAEQKGISLTSNWQETSVAETVELIENVTFGNQILPTMQKMSEIYHQLYKNPRKEAAFWLDHVMQYGGSYMRYSGQKMSWNLFVLGDCLLFLAGSAATFLFGIILLLLKWMCFRCFRHQKKRVKTE